MIQKETILYDNHQVPNNFILLCVAINELVLTFFLGIGTLLVAIVNTASQTRLQEQLQGILGIHYICGQFNNNNNNNGAMNIIN